MKLETKIILRGTLEDNSRDIKMILDMRKKAEELAAMARSCNEKNFDIADTPAKEGEITLFISCQTEEAKEKAKSISELLERVETEARKFYAMFSVAAKGPMGEAIEPIIKI